MNSYRIEIRRPLPACLPPSLRETLEQRVRLQTLRRHFRPIVHRALTMDEAYGRPMRA